MIIKFGNKVVPNLMQIAGKFFQPKTEKLFVSIPKQISSLSCKNLKLAPNMEYTEAASLEELTALRNLVLKNPEKIGMTKKDYYYLIDKISEAVKKQVEANPQCLRKEIVDNADKLHRWSEIFATQTFVNGKNVYSPFYDEKIFNQAVKDYTKFLETMTGKKVLIGCPSRMNVSAAGLLNDSNVYKNADVILIGHGHNSSLITDLSHPNTWRFSDNEQSIWEFIEKNTSRGDEIIAICCETNGLKLAGKTPEMMIDRSGNQMSGIGRTVDLSGSNHLEPIKICKNGIRHIIGDIDTTTEITSIAKTSGEFVMYGSRASKHTYYDLDFSPWIIS